jgi:hypothetical protein
MWNYLNNHNWYWNHKLLIAHDFSECSYLFLIVFIDTVSILDSIVLNESGELKVLWREVVVA